MKKHEQGFSIVEVVLILAVIGLIGAVGWLVWDRQKASDTAEQPEAAEQSRTQETPQIAKDNQPSHQTVEGTHFTTPDGWRNAAQPFEPFGANGRYLLSADYQEGGLGQLSIVSGAFIHFDELNWEGINADTTAQQALGIIKQSEGYLDAATAKIATIADRQVITYNSGHTTDGVSVLYKTAGKQWIHMSFSTSTGGDGVYNAQDSEHYPAFMKWVEEFIRLNP